MRARGFFVAPDRPADPDLAWVDIGKDQCAERLCDTRDPATEVRSMQWTAPVNRQLPTLNSELR